MTKGLNQHILQNLCFVNSLHILIKGHFAKFFQIIYLKNYMPNQPSYSQTMFNVKTSKMESVYVL